MLAHLGNAVTKNFNFQDKQQIDNVTKLDPENRYRSLRSFLNKINTNENSINDLKTWKLGFSEDTVTVQGKLMDNIVIRYKGGVNVAFNLKHRNQN